MPPFLLLCKRTEPTWVEVGGSRVTSFLVQLGWRGFLGGGASSAKSGTTNWVVGCLGGSVSAWAVQAADEMVLSPPGCISALLPCHGREPLVDHRS